MRRVNLDMFWSREASTVQGTVSDVRGIVNRSTASGRPVPLPLMAPWRVGDTQGMGVAMQMLEKSLAKGKNASDYTQFATCRKLRSAVTNIYGATAVGCEDPMTLKTSMHGSVLHLFQGSMQSRFMERFVLGMKVRMPAMTKQNKPITGRLVKAILDRIEAEWIDPDTTDERRRLLTMCGGYISVTYGYSLRGNEGLWVDAERLIEGIDIGRNPTHERPHVIVSLLGRFKGEDGDRMHVFPLATTTKSGVRIRMWLERVANLLRQEGKKNCPAFCDVDSYLMSEKTFEAVFHPILEEIQETQGNRGLIPPGLEVKENYYCFRSFRRGAEIEALNNEVDPNTIAFVHRWSKFEKSRGVEPSSFSMLEHYAEGVGTRPLQLSFSYNV